MNARFAYHATPLDGVRVVTRKNLDDSRGYFCRLFCSDELRHAGFQKPITQINYTHTSGQGAVRGLHFQHPPHAEVKLVSCLRGEVFDVAVDVRRDSPTFLHWHGEVLSAADCKSLLIPEGFAHGFQALTPNCELLYLHTVAYVPEAAAGLHPLDPAIGIDWPLKIGEMSQHDRSQTFVNDDFSGVTL